MGAWNLATWWHVPALSLAAAALIPLVAVELAKAARWRALFGPHRPSYLVCLRALVAGQLTNSLSPVRAGEAVRLGVVAAQGAALVPAAGALAAVKAVDTLCLAAIAAAVVGSSVVARPGAGLVGAAAVAVAGLALAIWGRPLRARVEALPLARRLRLASVFDVASQIREPRALGGLLATTAVVWGAGLAANVVVLAAAGVEPTLDLAARIIVAGYLAAAVPVTLPANVGVFEAAVTVALVSGGVPAPAALAAAVSLHVCQFVKLGILLAASVAVRRSRWFPSA